MDKELLRIVIILTGLLVMIGMILWHFIKTLREQRDHEEINDTEYQGQHEEADEVDQLATETYVDGDALLDSNALKPAKKEPPVIIVKNNPLTNSPEELPKLIEFRLMARDQHGFNGVHLLETFERVGLEYGSVKVFERVDQHRLVHFAVASVIGNGTFPDANVAEFYCPGIVFFLQPREVEQPLLVFDDLIETIDILALELDGIVLDKQKQPVTADTIAQLRQSLAPVTHR